MLLLLKNELQDNLYGRTQWQRGKDANRFKWTWLSDMGHGIPVKLTQTTPSVSWNASGVRFQTLTCRTLMNGKSPFSSLSQDPCRQWVFTNCTTWGKESVPIFFSWTCLLTCCCSNQVVVLEQSTVRRPSREDFCVENTKDNNQLKWEMIWWDITTIVRSTSTKLLEAKKPWENSIASRRARRWKACQSAWSSGLHWSTNTWTTV